MNLPTLDRQSFINSHRAGRPAFDFECLGREVVCGAECCRQRNRGSAIGKLEIDLCHQRLSVAANLVSFFPNRLLKLVQSELALLHDGCIRRRPLLPPHLETKQWKKDCCQEHALAAQITKFVHRKELCWKQ